MGNRFGERHSRHPELRAVDSQEAFPLSPAKLIIYLMDGFWGGREVEAWKLGSLEMLKPTRVAGHICT